MGPFGRLLCALVLTLWPLSAFATVPFEAWFDGLVVSDGKAIVSHRGGGFTVIDVSSGRVLRRERGRTAPSEWAPTASFLEPRHVGGPGFEFALSDGTVTALPASPRLEIDTRSERGSWHLALPLPSWGRVRHVWDFEDKLFIEMPVMFVGSLTCIDMRTGRILWRYVSAAVPQGLGPSRRREYTLQSIAGARVLLERARAERVGDAPQVFDPDPFPSGLELAGLGLRAWVPLVALPAAVLLLRWQGQMFPHRSRRQAAVTVGLVVWLAAALLAFGGIEAVATHLGGLMFTATLPLALRDIVRLPVAGGEWVIKVLLNLFLLGTGIVVLFSLVVL